MKFKFYVNLKEIHQMEGSREDALKYGDETATKHGDINVCMFVPGKQGLTITGEWQYLGIFLGNRRFLNWDRDYWTINSDYKGMTRMTARKGVASV